MAFGRFRFKKLWTSPTDFPTIEVDEAQVRADMQALHDESKDGLNQLMTELEEGTAAASLGAKTLDTGEDSTVQEVMAALRVEMQNGYKDLNKDRHTHENSTVLENITVALTDTLAAAYNRVVTLLGGITGVATTLGDDHTTIPTSKAVSDALTQAGNLPTGGETGQVLMKESDDNFDIEWKSIVVPEVAARVDFTAEDWVSEGSGYTLTVEQARHGRTNEAFACFLRHNVGGVLKQNTWAVLGTDSSFDADTGAITLSSADAYAGTALFVDQGK